MQQTMMGLVIKVVKTGEADRIIHILTPRLGVISAVAKGAHRIKSKLMSATELFSYAEFTLFEGKSMYIIDDAQVYNVFFGLRQSVEGMAACMYFAEVISTVMPTGAEAAALQRLMLNCLYFISENKRETALVKAIFELRSMSIAGYMPNLVACDNCVKYEGGAFYFDTTKGLLLCADCAADKGIAININEGALAAMRQIVFSDDDKVFSFRVGKQSLAQLTSVAAAYICICIDRPLKTLDFYNTLI